MIRTWLRDHRDQIEQDLPLLIAAVLLLVAVITCRLLGA